MQAAKDAVSKFTGRQGHTTEVDERTNAHVTQETVKPTRHENVTEALDREVHQHHHHTTVQPLQHQEVLPEKHAHNQLPTEHREFHHGNDSETKERLQMEAAKFKDTSRTHETTHTQAAMPSVQGEHVHHHVHETIQPVVHKETIQPEVVHSTQPIHEIHHADSQHHGTSVMPMKTLSEFSGTGGALGSGTTSGGRHEEYAGAPRRYNQAMQTEQTDADINPTNKGVDGPDSHHTGGTHLSGNEPFTDDGHMVQPGQKRYADGFGGGQSASTGTGTAGLGQRMGTTAPQNGTTGGYDRSARDREPGRFDGQDVSGTSNGGATGTGMGTGTGKKPSLMDKLNPKIDSNGDGKAGFMK